MLTTGSAARMCDVKPDTVLKWVRSGRLAATRTPGGHCRIDPRTLEEFLGARNARAAEVPVATEPSLCCWNYMSADGGVPARCQECLTFQSRASKCWTLRGCLEGRYGLHIIPCGSDCERCTFYDRIKTGVFRVLLVTKNRRFAENLVAEGGDGVEFRVAGDGYEAAEMLGEYCASLAVVDADLIHEEPKLLRHLLDDHRACGMRVAVAGRVRRSDRVPEGVVARLGIPFDVTEIQEIASWFPVEHIAAAACSLGERGGAGETPGHSG